MHTKRRTHPAVAQGMAVVPPAARALLALASVLLALCASAPAQDSPHAQEPSRQQPSEQQPSEAQPSPTPSPSPSPQESQPAQQREDLVPPPLRHLPEELRSRLSTAKDLKARTKLSIELADERIKRASAHLDADRWEAALADLGIYEGIIRDAVNTLHSSITEKKKHRDIIKRLEMALRSHVPRVETLRRGMPAPYAVHAQSTLDYVRDLRSETLNAFYDDTVIPDVPKGKAQDNERAKEAPHGKEGKP